MADSSQFSPLNTLSDQLGPNSWVSSVFIPAFIANIGKYFFLEILPAEFQINLKHLILWVPSQFVLKSIRTHFGQFVLKILVSSYSFGQFVLMSGQFVLILVNSYSNSNEYELTKMSTN